MDRRSLLKIRNGTRSGKRLCDTCDHGHIMKSDAESGEFVRCGYIDDYVLIRVVECTNYTDKSIPGLHELKAIAWHLRTDTSGQKIGFISPEKYRAERRQSEDDDELAE